MLGSNSLSKTNDSLSAPRLFTMAARTKVTLSASI